MYQKETCYLCSTVKTAFESGFSVTFFLMEGGLLHQNILIL